MSDSSLNASFWVMIMLQTLGAVDLPGYGPRKMPAPSAYATAIVAWMVLQLGADAGYEDGASKFGWLIVLASMVLGPVGKQLIKIINWIAKYYGNIGAPKNPTPADNTTTGVI